MLTGAQEAVRDFHNREMRDKEHLTQKKGQRTLREEVSGKALAQNLRLHLNISPVNDKTLFDKQLRFC